MKENGKQSNDWKLILGGILLIAVLFAGIKLVFWGLGQVIHQDVPDISQSASVSQSVEEDAPSFCIHCGRALPENFEWGQFCPYCGEKVE